jgi:hypothetical protein
MKALISSLILLFSVQTFAAADSVAVFHRAEKVVVLINDQGANSRLQQFMNALGADSKVQVESNESGIRVQCSRAADTASCTFAFFPSENVRIAPKNLDASTTLVDLGLKAISAEGFETSFESSREDRFTVKFNEHFIFFAASKR